MGTKLLLKEGGPRRGRADALGTRNGQGVKAGVST
jgi:hypothetical protein